MYTSWEHLLFYQLFMCSYFELAVTFLGRKKKKSFLFIQCFLLHWKVSFQCICVFEALGFIITHIGPLLNMLRYHKIMLVRIRLCMRFKVNSGNLYDKTAFECDTLDFIDSQQWRTSKRSNTVTISWTYFVFTPPPKKKKKKT